MFRLLTSKGKWTSFPTNWDFTFSLTCSDRFLLDLQPFLIMYVLIQIINTNIKPESPQDRG